MREEWISRTGAKRVLVVFGGWAIGPDPFVHLAQDCDLLFVSDYRELDWTPKGLDAYEERILLAWSFGVAGYAHWQDGRADPFTRKIAVNGTLTPADRHGHSADDLFQDPNRVVRRVISKLRCAGF